MGTLAEMAVQVEHCIRHSQPAAGTAELMQALAQFGPDQWAPLSPPRHAFNDFYAALANALLFVNGLELAELRRAELRIEDLLVSVRKRWSHERQGFTYSVVAGVSCDYSYTTVGQAHGLIQSELNGDPVF